MNGDLKHKATPRKRELDRESSATSGNRFVFQLDSPNRNGSSEISFTSRGTQTTLHILGRRSAPLYF